MALGAYSIIRYSNTLSDQRINLGIALWHPKDGMRFRFVPGLDRVRTIDPNTSLMPLRAQLKAIETELSAETASSETLQVLSRWFRTGVEVTAPYPARIQSADETAEVLFQRLVSPNPFIRSSSQRQFEQQFKKTLDAVARRSGARVEELGTRNLGDVTIALGLQTVIEHDGHATNAIWKPLSLQSYDATKLQLAFAKETAQDITVIKSLPEFQKQHIYVPVKPPKPSASAGLEESLAWLRRGGATNAFVEGTPAMEEILQAEFQHAFQTA